MQRDVGVYGLALMAFLICLWQAVAVAAETQESTPTDQICGERLVINYKSGQASLSAENRQEIKQLLDKYRLGPNDRILVMGHTDNQGSKAKNYQLSKIRATAVKKEILRHFKINAEIVSIIAEGPENPVADNRDKQGRAKNRRTEIYLTQVIGDRSKYERMKPDQAKIDPLIEEARQLLRQQKIPEALQRLQEARGYGGDEFSDWHAVYGMVGYYAGISAEKLLAHLTTALRLDPLQQEAREYYGRVEARQKVAAGVIRSYMGRSEDDAIFLTTVNQAHEYLRLFGMQPLSYRISSSGKFEVWQCRDPRGQGVSYYFDRSQVYDWALSQAPSEDDPL